MSWQLLTGRFPFWADVRNESLSDVWKVGGRAPGRVLLPPACAPA